MLSREALEKRARSAWAKVLRGTLPFPWEIPLGLPRGQRVLEEFVLIQRWAEDLRTLAQQHQLELKETSLRHRQLGWQQLPVLLVVPDRDSYLRWLRLEELYGVWQRWMHESKRCFPELESYLDEKPEIVLDHLEIWARCLAILAHFRRTDVTGRYLRELDIEGVDSKFIEQHRHLLDPLLHRLLKEPSVPFEASGPIRTFCERYGLRYDPILLRFRWLDPVLAGRVLGLRDLSVPVEEFARLSAPVRCVFVTENKTNFLSFPDVEGGMVIFGQGGAVGLLAKVPWLQDLPVYYWGDLDTHGFAILARLRRVLPGLHSLLMDRETLEHGRAAWVTEEQPNTDHSILDGLQPDEAAVYRDLCGDRYGDRVRLEQERVPMSRVQAVLERIALTRWSLSAPKDPSLPSLPSHR